MLPHQNQDVIRRKGQHTFYYPYYKHKDGFCKHFFENFSIFLNFFEFLACFPLSRRADGVFDSKWQHIWTTLGYADMIRGLILRVPKRHFLRFWGPCNLLQNESSGKLQ